MNEIAKSDEVVEITRLLERLVDDRDEVLSSLFIATYAELRGMAGRQRARLGAPNTLATTALVHEVFLKLQRAGDLSLESRQHFFSLISRAMRQLLLDRLRSPRLRDLHHGSESELPSPLNDSDQQWWIDLDRALTLLARIDERLVKVVELRFFAGLSDPEIAELLGVTDRTVRRDWNKARAWLAEECRDWE